jgi:hypothetical protein
MLVRGSNRTLEDSVHKETAVAVDIDLDEPLLPDDETAEEAFERAMTAWRTARARIETVRPEHLPRVLREEYYRMLVRIGLWADARVAGEPVSDDDAVTPDEPAAGADDEEE